MTLNRGSARADVIIVGAGIAGSAVAAALAPGGLRVLLVEAGELPATLPALADSVRAVDPRVSALSVASTRLLARLGAWERIPDAARSPYEHMRVWEEDGTGLIEFAAADIHEPLLGHIVENRWITAALLESLRDRDNVELLGGARVQSLELPVDASSPVRVVLDSGAACDCSLLIGADGARSVVRRLCGIDSREWDCEQRAIVATVRAGQAHRRTAWQCFLRSGPVAFLPLATLPDERCGSVVWSADNAEAERLMALGDREFAAALGGALDFRLGNIEEVSRRFCFPLRQHHAATYTMPGVALVGDAAHVVHPLAGQGINLGLGDVRVLADEVARGLARGRGPGHAEVLGRYQRRRRGDNELMLQVMGGFRRLYGDDRLPVRLARNIGMSTVNRIGPLKHQLMRRAMGI